MHGLRVISDEIPSYAEYKSIILTNGWERDLLTLTNQSSLNINEFNFEYFKEANEEIIEQWVSLFSDTAFHA